MSIVRNFDSMLRQEQYHKIMNTFGVELGIAEWEGNFYPRYSNLKDIPDELKVNILTDYIIKEGIYQQVHRELHHLKKKWGKRRIKESTLYEKAITMVSER